ncbi:MAG: MarR family transcriptional regulator [Deltaproteobacteria bacterium]|nr:MarR family transcriptional regulator [Deltaproteobacteria bacterium]
MSEARLVKSIQRLASALAKQERQTAAGFGVSVSQMRLLSSLETTQAPARISDLATEQGLAVSTMTRNLALLEEKGFLRRVPGADDKRTVTVELSESGRALAAKLSDTNIARFAQAFRGFHPTDRVERAVALDRVAAAIEKIDDEPEGS